MSHKVCCLREVVPVPVVSRCRADVDRCFDLLEAKLKAEHGVTLSDATTLPLHHCLSTAFSVTFHCPFSPVPFRRRFRARYDVRSEFDFEEVRRRPGNRVDSRCANGCMLSRVGPVRCC